MTTITQPHSPLTTFNSDGFAQTDLDRLNAAYVEAWNHLYGDEEIDDHDVQQLSKSLWDAVGNADGNLTIVLDRMGR